MGAVMTAYLDWKAGDKLVCVDAVNNPNCKWQPGERIEEGKVYTIKAILIDADGMLVVSLVELPRRMDIHGFPGYSVKRFRRVPKRKTDISIFTALLNPTKVTA